MSQATTKSLIARLTTELRAAHAKRFWLISRIKDEEFRKKLELGDAWQVHKFYDKEDHALGDLIFLTNATNQRDYQLFAELPRVDGLEVAPGLEDVPWDEPLDDRLDDIVPY